MKYCLFFLLSFFTSCCSSITNEEKLINKIINTQVEDLSKNYDVSVVSVGIQMPDKIHSVSAHYWIRSKLTLEEARKVYINILRELIINLNNSNSLRPALYEYPLTTKNVGLMIGFIKDDSVQKVDPPNIALILSNEVTIFYEIYNHQINKFEEVYEESIEDAFRIVAEEEASSLPK